MATHCKYTAWNIQSTFCTEQILTKNRAQAEVNDFSENVCTLKAYFEWQII